MDARHSDRELASKKKPQVTGGTPFWMGLLRVRWGTVMGEGNPINCYIALIDDGCDASSTAALIGEDGAVAASKKKPRTHCYRGFSDPCGGTYGGP